MSDCRNGGRFSHRWSDQVWHEPLPSARSDGSEPAADADEVADYVRKMDALLCRLTNGKFSKSWAYDVDFMESCVNEEFEALYDEEVGELRDRVGRLTAERDNLARDLEDCEREREKWRDACGRMLDAAHEIQRISASLGN